MDTEIKELWDKARPTLINIGNVLVLAFLIWVAVSFFTTNPDMKKIAVYWDYENYDEADIDGFELFIGYRRGDQNELIEINKTDREHEFRYEIKPYQNVYLALVAYYDIPVGKKKVRWRSPPAKISLYPDPPTNFGIDIIHRKETENEGLMEL